MYPCIICLPKAITIIYNDITRLVFCMLFHMLLALMCCTAPPSIVIPLEQRVITVVRDEQPNTTFICEATRVPACTPQISWIHNGMNTSESTDQRFRASITGNTERTIRSTLNATQLRGRDSGRIDCVAHCTVDIPDGEPLNLATFRNTTLSVLSKCVDSLCQCLFLGDLCIIIFSL